MATQNFDKFIVGKYYRLSDQTYSCNKNGCCLSSFKVTSKVSTIILQLVCLQCDRTYDLGIHLVDRFLSEWASRYTEVSTVIRLPESSSAG